MSWKPVEALSYSEALTSALSLPMQSELAQFLRVKHPETVSLKQRKARRYNANSKKVV